MSNLTTDYINPYSNVALLYKRGMDYIINSLSGPPSSSLVTPPSDFTAEKLIDCVCKYLFSITNTDTADPSNLLKVTSVKVAVTNALNGYLDKGDLALIVSKGLNLVPVQSIGSYFDRLDQAIQASDTIRSNRSRGQLAISIGRSSYDYWISQVKNIETTPWSIYFDGNVAIDMANIPFWVSASMFGSQFNFYQNNANDSEAVSFALYTALGGALVVGAGKVIFGWVSKVEDDMISDFVENFE